MVILQVSRVRQVVDFVLTEDEKVSIFVQIMTEPTEELAPNMHDC